MEVRGYYVCTRLLGPTEHYGYGFYDGHAVCFVALELWDSGSNVKGRFGNFSYNLSFTYQHQCVISSHNMGMLFKTSPLALVSCLAISGQLLKTWLVK